MTAGRRPSPVPGPRVRTKAVMVVEDNTAIREGLTSLLEEEGHQVIAVANGLEALEQLRWGNKPCLILLDLRMTVMTGWEFRAQQKQDPALAAIPVIAITAHAMVGDRETALAAGCSECLIKPYEIVDLVRVVERFVGPAHAQSA